MKTKLNRIISALLIAIIASANIFQTGMAMGSSQPTTKEQGSARVQKAAMAGGLNVKPSLAYTIPAKCPSGYEPTPSDILFADDMESGAGNWDFLAPVHTPPYTSNWSITTPGLSSSANSLLGPGESYANDSYAAMKVSKAQSLQNNVSSYLYFEHEFDFETTDDPSIAFDGGVLEYSANGGGWQDAGPLFSAGQNYNSTITTQTGYGNPLEGGRQVFSGISDGVVASRYDLSSLAGKSVRFRWRIGSDYSNASTGWHVDNVKIYTCPGAGAGMYDDTDSRWFYTYSNTDRWIAYTGSGLYNNTLHYTSKVGNAAWFAFVGTQFILTYTQSTNRGKIDVYVDGSKITTINANGAVQWQKPYISSVYSSGPHLVQLKHAGGGAYIDVDAIQILDTAAPGADTYDDANANWFYTGAWTPYAGSGPANDTLHYTSTVGNAASFTFSGTQFIFTYTQSTNRGNIDVYVDGDKETTINANGPVLWQKKFTSSIFPPGTHVVQFKHAGGAYIDVDAIQILDTILPGAGTYDDADANWLYTGAWITYAGSGPYNNTLHYTSTTGDTASFTFSGIQFILTYTQSTNRGNIDVYVDGSKITTINANGAVQWQKVYVSPVYSSGPHRVQLKHAGGGTYIDVDAIQILDAAAPGAGIYDDADANWFYTGAWTDYAGGGPANDTLHYTSTVGNAASFTFSGTQFVLTYTQSTNRGNIDVYLDGSYETTINANGAMQWQKTFTSPIFSPGTHVVQFKHGGGGYIIDVDAIEILDTAIPGAGIYDDADANWFYTGAWITYAGGGPANDTLHYTSTMGSAASFTFSGTQFILTYTQSTNRGNIDVYVDGSKITTINANGAMQWQKTFTSPVFQPGTHVVQFKHAGGAYIDVDAIEIQGTTAPGAGIYDNTDANWLYTGAWITYAGSGPYNNTLHYTSTTGDAASFTFSGIQFILTYTQSTNRGKIDVYVDGSKITTINANGAVQWQKVYVSPVYSSGPHLVQFKHAGGGIYIDVDAIQILDAAAPGANTYDDADANWFYTGAWTDYAGGGPANDTLHYTSTVGNAASFTFSGTQFILTYTQSTNRGNIDVYLDGSYETTINANGAIQWQKTFTSPIFPPGTHVVQFKHGGGGYIIDVDAIQILDTILPGAGTYDDADANWFYTGAWTDYAGGGPANNTLHYTSTVGNAASFTFSGTQFVLTYTQSTNRGNIDVYVDGSYETTINANGAMQWQKTFTSPIFPPGTHVVQFKHGGGGYIDVDAIQILDTAAPGAGTYDDADANWFYTGAWITYAGGGPANDTLHYTSTVGSAASFTFSGTQFVLTYTQSTNRGNIDVYVDGAYETTINANGSVQWKMMYASPVYPSAGPHRVQFKHAGGAYIDVDAIEIIN